MAEGGISLARSGESIDECSGDPDSLSHGQRSKSDRIAITKSEEDRRRRTIIVEKANGSYGFTLQSYGIHYKKEQEVEMITYVDYVEYDGPAYKSGMREGDVILSINGSDMEKADHKALVTFIQNCDSRMRMVVLFEDCVRKVELHMRYIQLQSILQEKMNELEKTCLKERELLEGKWKTRSLPAPRKKGSNVNGANANASPSEENIATATTDDTTGGCFPSARPISTEDVNLSRTQKITVPLIPPPAQFMLTYQYLDPRYRYILRPSTSNSSGEYLLSIGPPTRSKSEHQDFYGSRQGSVETMQSTLNSSSQVDYEMASNLSNANVQTQKQETTKHSKSRHFQGHSCNPCLGHRKDKQNNGDNESLEAYDLANPCCNPQCVPTRRKKTKEHKHKHRDKESKEQTQRPRSQSHVSMQVENSSPAAPQPFHAVEKHHNHHRLYDLSNQLASRCSLHSCISSNDFDAGAAAMAESSTTSYTTSLSTDTLYWDPHSDVSVNNSRQQSTKSRQSYPDHQLTSNPAISSSKPHHHHHHHHRYHHKITTQNITQSNVKCSGAYTAAPLQSHVQYIQQKPKSWDNIAGKSVLGGQTVHGYLNQSDIRNSQTPAAQQSQLVCSSHTRLPTVDSNEMISAKQQRHSIPRRNPFGRYSTLNIENYAPPPSQFTQEFNANTNNPVTKSTDNLIPSYNHSDTNINTSYNCKAIETQNKILRQNSQPNDGYYSRLSKANFVSSGSQTTNDVSNGKTDNVNNVASVSEITRL